MGLEGVETCEMRGEGYSTVLYTYTRDESRKGRGTSSLELIVIVLDVLISNIPASLSSFSGRL